MASTVMHKVSDKAMMRLHQEYPGLSAAGLVKLLVGMYESEQVSIDQAAVLDYYRQREANMKRGNKPKLS